MARITSIIVVVFVVFLSSTEYLFAQSGVLRNVEAMILKDAYPQAAKECEKILASQHRSTIKSKAYYLLGICHLKEARYEEARKNFNKILRQYRRSKFCDDATLGIADSYFLAGDYHQALEKYEEFLQRFARSELSSIAWMHLEQCKQARPFVNSYFSVQLGCFSNKRNAEKLRDGLIDNGYQAYILELISDSQYRVRVGKFSTRLQAELLEQRLKVEGYTTKICP